MTKQRKKDHIQICLDKKIEFGTTGFEKYRFIHCALPEINFKNIDLTINFLGKELSAPILISSLTGGTERAKKINQNLAKAAQEFNLAMAVGSQRVAIENPKLEDTFKVRKYAPDVVLLGNLGAVQLNYGYGIEECREAIEMIDADGLFFHLNPLQEVIQQEGDKNFSNLLEKIKEINEKLKKPVLVKEVGTGISYRVAKALHDNGIKFVDVAGFGGTNWAVIEGLRRDKDKQLGQIFSGWGISTAESLIQCRKLKELTLIGSGGIRTGIDIAKALALGADLVGIGLPLLKPATKSAPAVKKKLESLILELKIAMFCVGAKDISQLKQVELKRINVLPYF